VAPPSIAAHTTKQATCEGLVDSHACGDDTVVSTVIGQLERAAKGTLGNRTDQPFFIAAGSVGALRLNGLPMRMWL
jgi:hypothetical protein